MQKFKEMINLEELLEAIENYKSLVELNMPKGYTLEGLPITERLNQQIENAKKQLKNKNLTINVKCEIPDVKEFADEFARKLKESIKCGACR